MSESCVPVECLCIAGLASELLAYSVNSVDEEVRTILSWTNDDSYQGLRKMMNNICLKL